MELGLVSDLVIKCSECESIYVISKDSLCVEMYSYERNMGEEVEYNFVGEYCCDECGNQMQYVIRAYEYPIGALNYEAYEEHGCTFVHEPSVEISYFEFEYDSFDEEEISAEVSRACINVFRVLQDQEEVYRFSPREFEEFVAELFRRNGFEVELTPETRDGGYDIIATRNISGLPFMLLIECKKYAKGNPVGVNLVRSLMGVQGDCKANKAVLVTTSRFTKQAREFANRQQHLISLMDINDLMRMIPR